MGKKKLPTTTRQDLMRAKRQLEHLNKQLGYLEAISYGIAAIDALIELLYEKPKRKR